MWLQGNKKHLAAVSMIMAALLVAVLTTAAETERVFPGVDWERDTNGLSPESVREVNAFVRTLDTTGLMVVKGGRVVYEYGDVQRLSYLASARKSILSMIYGANIASGKIHLDATVKELGISDLGGLLPIEEQAKVIDLITARSGVYHVASNGGYDKSLASKRGAKQPGSYWVYNNWDFNVAGAVLEQMTGKNIYDSLRDDLAIPIGMQDFDRQRQQKSGDMTNSVYSAYHMVLSTRDMARLGLLMLRQGRWGDRQVIPAEWVRRSTGARTPWADMRENRSEPFGYGYMWWVWDGPSAAGPYQGAYTADGAYGQYITVLPAVDMVVAHKTWSAGVVGEEDYLRLLDLLTGKKPATPVELDLWERFPFLYDSYAGQYKISSNVPPGTNTVPSDVGVRRDGNRLLLQLSLPQLQLVLNLRPKSETNFFSPVLGRPVAFYRDGQGKVNRLAVRLSGKDLSFEKFSDQPPAAPTFEKSHVAIKLDPHIYDAYAGRYSAAPHSSLASTRAITIKRDGDALICQKFTGQKPRRFPEQYFPASETNFFNTTEDNELTIVKNDRGEVTSVIVVENGLFGDTGRIEYKVEK